MIKALAVSTADDCDAPKVYGQVADYLLFDSRPGPSGGTARRRGTRVRLAAVSGIRLDRPWGIAGGLTPENVARAIAIAAPLFVDASSGVEDAPGRKNREKIAAFVSAARGAVTALEAAAIRGMKVGAEQLSLRPGSSGAFRRVRRTLCGRDADASAAGSGTGLDCVEG